MKRALQIVLGVLSLIPLTSGISGMIMGPALFIPQENVVPSLDSQFRFESAYYFSLAIVIWWLIPNVEKHTNLFRILVMGLFVGGLSRLYSYLTIGTPEVSMQIGMYLELALPLLIIWQAKLPK